jgi:hypothetical protein
MANLKIPPSWWERQDQRTGATYPDPTLVSTLPQAHARSAIIGVSREDSAPYPGYSVVAEDGFFSYGQIASTRPEQSILAFEDHRPISHVDMFQGFFGLEEDGWYLIKK